jgi:geranylgeranyl diphosphate synthase type II
MTQDTRPFSAVFTEAQEFVEARLQNISQDLASPAPPRLRDSMTYSLAAGGKRLRPILCLKAAEVFGMSGEICLPMALGLEMIHTASLIHDDLPAMDNDILRRGKPTNHVLFGESLAILAGDALMAWAFEYPLTRLPRYGIPAERICEAMKILANALGPFGICGGQVLDTDSESIEETEDFPFKVARQKTAVLIAASVETGAVLAGADRDSAKAFRKYGEHVGTAFQMVDDILDVTSSAEELGKTPGKDATQDKRTFISIFGLDKTREMARTESESAVNALREVPGNVEFFVALSDYLVERTR